MSMFRASPWVTYDPTANQAQLLGAHEMDQNVDMDAPQISTLREEETPPPQPKSISNARRNKPGSKARATDFPPWARRNPEEPLTEEEYDEGEEEDQLIDDDDDDMMKQVPPTVLSGRSADITPKRKIPSKRKPRRSEKRVAEDERRAREKVISKGAPNLAPAMTWLEAMPSETPDDRGQVDVGQISLSSSAAGPVLPVATSAKKASSRKAPVAPRVKVKVPPKLKTMPLILADDTGILSEGYTGTAASSPVTVPFDANSPDPDAGSLAPSAIPLIDDTSLENVPVPVYPLPTKPFPVQPPPKVGTGFAPLIPLDKSGKKVRHWRTAHREIRGIAGGRWFTRSWVGEKESEFASAVAASSAQAKSGEERQSGVALPKLSVVSISATPSGKGLSRSKTSKAASSLTASAAPSRAGSMIPDSLPGSSTRAPPKMRTILRLAPPSDDGDSDMAPPSGS